MSESGPEEPLPVARNRVVSFHYEMRSQDGTVLESTRDEGPHVLLYGYGGVIKGLEMALQGKRPGDQFEVTLPPEQAFGLRTEGRTERISKKHFPKGARLAAGMVTALRSERGMQPVTIVKVGNSVVDVDMNHPRAGMTLSLDVSVESVREATAEEKAHGHAHGPGGHQH